MELVKTDLKELAKIILEIKEKYKDKALNMLLQMKWEIGEKIFVSRVKQTESFRELETKTGINFIDLQRCNKFYEKYQNGNYPVIAWREYANNLLIEDKTKDINIILPEDEYQVYVIDPPWKYGRLYDSKTSRVASPYIERPTEIILEQLQNKLKPYKDSIMFLWTTHRFIWDAKMILDELEYEYKAIITWDKEKLGMGSWLRMQCEFCLLGIKGKPIWELTNERDIIREARRQHSRKPEKFYDMILKLTPDMKRADIFTRTKRDGFDSFGDEIDKYE